jgi:hypothetical protein
VWDVSLFTSSAETVKCVSKVILLTSVKKNFIIFITLFMRAKSLLILRFILVATSCIRRRTKQDRQCAYNIFWCVRVTFVSNETQQCVVCVLLSHVSLSVNIQHCATMLNGQFMSPTTVLPYLGLCVKCPLFRARC